MKLNCNQRLSHKEHDSRIGLESHMLQVLPTWWRVPCAVAQGPTFIRALCLVRCSFLTIWKFLNIFEHGLYILFFTGPRCDVFGPRNMNLMAPHCNPMWHPCQGKSDPVNGTAGSFRNPVDPFNWIMLKASPFTSDTIFRLLLLSLMPLTSTSLARSYN